MRIAGDRSGHYNMSLDDGHGQLEARPGPDLSRPVAGRVDDPVAGDGAISRSHPLHTIRLDHQARGCNTFQDADPHLAGPGGIGHHHAVRVQHAFLGQVEADFDLFQVKPRGELVDVGWRDQGTFDVHRLQEGIPLAQPRDRVGAGQDQTADGYIVRAGA